MFSRDILSELERWADSRRRKPLVLRGARQVGKTVAVKLFAERFDRFVYVNLDLPGEANLFRRGLSVQDVFQALLLKSRTPASEGPVLLFLDEVQSCPEAVESLRYFYEMLPEVHVVAAGSLLEIALEKTHIAFPVGRVEHSFMHPLSFREFLSAMDAEQAVAAFETIPFPAYAHSAVIEHFHRYALIGGMPEVVATYLEENEIAGLSRVYDSLITSYLDDAAKYARNASMARVLRHCIETAPFMAGRRITFAGFGHSNYGSREVGEALRTLERAMVIYLLYPSTALEIPVLPNLKKPPRLQFLDTGLLNYFAGLQEQFFHHDDLHAFYKGILAEHVVGQELIAMEPNTRKKQCFWVREKRGARAEVDFLVPHREHAIPVEVKSGPTGRLRSLHEFMDRCPHGCAVRLYSGPLTLDHLKTPGGKAFRLLNLPYFLASKIHEYVDWMREEVAK